MTSLVHKRFYADTEHNSGGGTLLSAALVSSDGDRWYGANQLPEGVVLESWPKEHVIPVLGIHMVPREEMVASLHSFLSQYDAVTIVVDNNTDAKHLSHLMAELELTTVINLQFVRPTVAVKHLSKVPHNALSDAYGLMTAVLGSEAINAQGFSQRSVYTQLEAVGAHLNAINSDIEFLSYKDNGDIVVKVAPVKTKGARTTLDQWTDSYAHAIGQCFITVEG